MLRASKNNILAFLHSKKGFILSVGVILVIWTFLVWLSMTNIWSNQEDVAYSSAVEAARSMVEKDIIYRRWNVESGGVYVPVSERNKPNPHLKQLSHRDIETVDGNKYTLVNPSYMGRQVHFLELENNKTIGRITSLNPLALENKADEWETNAMRLFEGGMEEFSSIEVEDENTYVRFMKPLRVEKSCMSCHEEQGYEIGQHRGGISVKMPMGLYLTKLNEKKSIIATRHALFWIMGVLSIGIGCGLYLRRKNDLLKHNSLLIAEKERFECVMNALDAVVYVADLETYEMLFMNKKALDMVGEYRGQKCWELIQSGQLGPCQFCTNSKLVDNHGKSTGPYVWEHQNTRNGEWYECRDEAIPWTDGRLVRIEIATVITQRKQAELDMVEAKKVAEHAKKCREDFLAVMSHEMRTPLNPIIGFADLMLQDHDEEPERSYLKSIIRSANHQVELINNLLSYSKLEKKNVEITEIEFDLVQVCQQSISDVKHHAQGLAVEFVNGAYHELLVPGVIVKGDREMLVQLLENLLNNSAKYTIDGSITLHVGMEPNDDGKDLFYFDVIDTGIGMTEDVQKTLFSPFIQADNSSTREYDGIGLGLAICRRMVDSMGGAIGVKSKLGEGSHFWFQLPFDTIYTPEPEEQDVVLSLPDMKLSKACHILIVEDRQDNIFILQTMLSEIGASFEIAEDGEYAYRLCQENLYDIVLMDLSMPVMNGYEATSIIRNEDNLNQKTPVIALSADVTAGVEDRCIKSGMNGYLPKPIDFRKLYGLISSLIR